MKSVQIQNFSGPHFLAFIRTEYGKYGPERTSYLHTYHAVLKKALPRRNYVRQGQTDLLYASAKDLIQSRRIQIRVASLSLVSFRHLSVC